MCSKTLENPSNFLVAKPSMKHDLYHEFPEEFSSPLTDPLTNGRASVSRRRSCQATWCDVYTVRHTGAVLANAWDIF